MRLHAQRAREEALLALRAAHRRVGRAAGAGPRQGALQTREYSRSTHTLDLRCRRELTVGSYIKLSTTFQNKKQCSRQLQCEVPCQLC